MVKALSLDSPKMPIYLCMFYPDRDRITQTETAFIERLKKFYPEFQVLK